jgi:hypothetical protein
MSAEAIALTAKKDPYGFTNAFERAFVTMLCTRPRIWALLGEWVDGACFKFDASRHALQAARLVHTSTGHGPDSNLILMQRLNALVNDGKLARDEMLAVLEMTYRAAEAGFPSDEALLGEVAPMLRLRARQSALDEGLKQLRAAKDDDTKIRDRLERASKIGTVELGVGSTLGPATLDEIEHLRHVQRLPTGIMELDDALGGGPLRGTLSMWLGGSGGGKSMGLIQAATAGAFAGFNVGYMTLELPKVIIEARLLANITNIPIDDIVQSPKTCGVRESLEKIQAVHFGRIAVRTFTPKLTSITDAREWMKRAEDEWGAADGRAHRRLRRQDARTRPLRPRTGQHVPGRRHRLRRAVHVGARREAMVLDRQPVQAR